MAFEIMDDQDSNTQVLIKVIGVGGGGCNAVRQMMDFDSEGVELIAANTDMQVLKKSPIAKKLQLGAETTKGMGAGSKPEVGKRAAEEDRDKIIDHLKGADLVFIAAGMGGGTGTGAAPVIAGIARELGILTIAIVTKPFFFEGAKRIQLAENGLETLKEQVDCLIVIPNDRISDVMGEEATLLGSFQTVDDVLKNGVQSLVNVIQKEGIINMDLEDVKTIMSERGIAMMGTGEAEGEDRAVTATQKAISSPLLENIDLSLARGLLVNITANHNFKNSEYKAVGSLIFDLVDQDVINVKIGVMIDDEMGDIIRVTVVATGISGINELQEYGNTISDADGFISVVNNENDTMNENNQKSNNYKNNLNIPSILRRRVK